MAETDNPSRAALEDALSAVGGSKTVLMHKLNERGWDITSHNVIGQWLKNGVPPKYCPDIEALTGITCEALCPEVKWGLVRDRRRAPRREAKAQATSPHREGPSRSP